MQRGETLVVVEYLIQRLCALPELQADTKNKNPQLSRGTAAPWGRSSSWAEQGNPHVPAHRLL